MSNEHSPPDLATLAARAGCDIVELRFTDLLGRWLGVSCWTKALAPGESAIFVASSNVAGWGRLAQSDLLLRPDLTTAWRDPGTSRPTLSVICECVDPARRQTSPLDTRATLVRALALLAADGVADTLLVGPELEFYLFDDVRFHVSPSECFFRVDARDALENTRREYAGGNRGHRMIYPAFHLAPAPIDADAAWRTELLALAEQAGLEPLKHQHEAGPGQHEIVLRHAPALHAADRIQIAKFLVLNAAERAGRSATFMPKPLAYQPGSGLHLNLSLRRAGAAVFAGAEGGQCARHFIAGIFAHAPALNAITNPGTNSFKRLATLFSPNVALAYGVANRAAAIRVPSALTEDALRLELRFPDAVANPYLAIAALLMAGLDGIARRLDPGPPTETDPRQEVENWDLRQRAAPGFALDLGEAILALDRDRDFLSRAGVFSEVLIETLIGELTRQLRVNRALPHPNEYYLYFST